MSLHEALFYSHDKDDIICRLCAHRCRIKPRRRGRCGVRMHLDETLYTLVYGELVAEHLDPIEKKPLFHVLPGSLSLSISTLGCNFTCKHCQNSSISQAAQLAPGEIGGKKSSPEQIVANALRQGCKTISYTYVEPTVFYEFAYDICVLAKEEKLRNVFVSNGYLGEEPIKKIAPFLDAINIDIKSFRDGFYREICGARLHPVLDSVRLFKDLGVWVEITTLVIPGINDSDEELSDIASFIVDVDPAIPWHVSAFYPTYKMTDHHSTPQSTLARARKIGRSSGLHHVYEGNMRGAGGENTCCPSCGTTVIERYGFAIRKNTLKNGFCPQCGARLHGIWD